MVVALSVLTAWIVIRGKASSVITAGKLRSRFERPAYNSCRNRHCPKCQSLAKVKWLNKQKSECRPFSSQKEARGYATVFVARARERARGALPCSLNAAEHFHCARNLAVHRTRNSTLLWRK